MKFSKVFATVSLFIAGIAAQQQQFNLTALNGTWNLQGIPKSLFSQIGIMSRLFNISLDCPQLYVTGNASNVLYIQPSVDFKWYNASSKVAETANISMSGLLTLQNGSNATDANFTAQFSLPRFAQGQTATHLQMLDTAFTGGNVSNPLPHGVDYYANFTVKLISSGRNQSVYDSVFVNAYNFTSTHDDDNNNGKGNFERRAPHDDDDDNMDDAMQAIFSNTTIDNTTFQSLVQQVGPLAANLTFINTTCATAQK